MNTVFSLKSLGVSAIAALFAASITATPASAGGGHYGFGYHNGFHGGGFYNVGYRRGFRHGRYRHGRYRRGGGGRAAAIALGTVGGLIVVNEIAQANARARAAEARYYDRYYDRYRGYPASRVIIDGREINADDAFQRGFEEGYARGRDQTSLEPQPGRQSTPNGNADDLERRLEGGSIDTRETFREGGPSAIRFTASGAYDACRRHARRALDDQGYILAAPVSPETVEVAGADVYRVTATVRAQSDNGSWQRAMVCEARAGQVLMLELI